MLRVICKSVDKYGFCGRDFHPTEADIGSVWTVVHLSTELSQGCGTIEMVDSSRCFDEAETEVLIGMSSQDEAGSDCLYQVMNCVNAAGEKRTFISFEVEFCK